MSVYMSNKKPKSYYNKIRQEFLLSFFEKDEYSEKEINGFWLVKSWNGDSHNWQVSIYSQEAYNNFKKAGENFKLWKEQTNLNL